VTYGIVADGVDRVEVQRNDGTTSDAIVSGDAFLDIDRRPELSRWVSRIWAWSDGRRVEVPFVPEQLMFGFSTHATTTRKPRGPATRRAEDPRRHHPVGRAPRAARNARLAEDARPVRDSGGRVRTDGDARPRSAPEAHDRQRA